MADTVTLRNKNTGETVTLRRKASVPSAETDLGFGNVEAKINQPLPDRPNPFMAGADAVKYLTMKDFIPGNIQGMGNQGMALLQVLGAPYQAAESIVANRALSGQKDMKTFLNPQEGLRDVVAGLTGPHRTMEDVNYRAGMDRGTGAKALALGQNVAVQGPELVEGAYKLGSKGIKAIGSGISKSKQGLSDIFGASKKLSEAKVNTQVLINKADDLKDAGRQAFEGLKDASTDDAVLYKNKLKPLSKSNSAIYRKGLDKAEKTFKFDEANLKGLVDDTISELSEQGIGTDSEVFNRLSKLSEELTPKSSRNFDYTVMQDVDTVEPVKNLTLEQVKNIKSSIFDVADKSFNYKDEIANAIFSKNYGSKVASNNPAFQKMQAEYAPYVEAKKWAYRTFKPQTAEEIPNGNRILKAIAQGKGQAEHFAYLKRLEGGSGRFKGTGNLRGQSQSFADELKNISSEINRIQGLKVKNRAEIQTLESLDRKRKYVIFGALATLGAISGVGSQAKKIGSGIQNLLPV